MKDWRRRWLYEQTHQPNIYEKSMESTPLVRTKSGYYRTNKGDNIWRESQRDKLKFMKSHVPVQRKTGTEKMANLIHKAYFGGKDE